METTMVRESWTDERLDDFRGETARRFDEVDRRFDDVDRRFDEARIETARRFDEAKAEMSQRFDEAKTETAHRFDEVNRRIGEQTEDIREFRVAFLGLQRAFLQAGAGLIATMTIGFASILVALA